MNPLDLFRVQEPADPAWREVLKIYRETFPESEREPEHVLTSRMDEGRYVVYACALTDGRIVAFHIVDAVLPSQYAVFSYLGVTEKYRGKGYGTALCQHAIESFRQNEALRIMYIGADDRQSRFYGHLGFLRLDLDYRVPRPDGGSEPKHLLAMPMGDHVAALLKSELGKVIMSIFVDGYRLTPGDPRIDEQLARIPERTRLQPWPPAGQ